jgi:hypothetical protein
VATLTDPERLQAFRDALRNCHEAMAKGAPTNYIQFRLNETAYRYVRDMLGVTLDVIKKRVCEYVLDEAGRIDEQIETREGWSEEFQFHHDLRVKIEERLVYVETRLHYRLPIVPDDSWIEVVNIHDP